MQIAQQLACYCCGSEALSPTFRYSAAPAGETRFPFSEGNGYRRDVFSCRKCGHYMSLHGMDDARLYSQQYVDATYGDDTLTPAFERIISLDAGQSDNVGRCERVVQFAQRWLEAPIRENRRPTILDVGSGLCVFLHGMQAAGWNGTALDPDPRAVKHAREVVGVAAVCGDFMEVTELGRFDVITFNKVLEHVVDPLSMLTRSKDFLDRSGFVYIELPDGEVAARHGPDREEFFIEHHHIFSFTSLSLLATRAGFVVQSMERLQEPSTKFTLRALLTTA